MLINYKHKICCQYAKDYLTTDSPKVVSPKLGVISAKTDEYMYDDNFHNKTYGNQNEINCNLMSFKEIVHSMRGVLNE